MIVDSFGYSIPSVLHLANLGCSIHVNTIPSLTLCSFFDYVPAAARRHEFDVALLSALTYVPSQISPASYVMQHLGRAALSMYKNMPQGIRCLRESLLEKWKTLISYDEMLWKEK